MTNNTHIVYTYSVHQVCFFFTDRKATYFDSAPLAIPTLTLLVVSACSNSMIPIRKRLGDTVLKD